MRDLINLLEAQEYALLMENEQRANWLIQNMGAKADAKYKAELTAGSVPAQIASQITDEDPAAETAKLVNYLMSGDPTGNKGYSRWIATRFIKGNERLEDVPGLTTTLAAFARAAQAKRVDGNIDSYKSFSDLYTAVEPFLVGDREVSGKMDRKNKRETKVDTRVARLWDESDPMRTQAKVIYDSDNYIIVSPETAEAATYFGKNTNWCTTTNMFQYYNQSEPLYIILRRRDGRKWQFHFHSRQYMDERDRPIDLNEWIDENREAFEALGPAKFGVQIGAGSNSLALRHFTAEQLAELSDDDLAKAVHTVADLSAMGDRANSEGMCRAILGNIAIGRRSLISDAAAPKIVKYYLHLFKDPDFYERICQEGVKLIRFLPERYQTDQAKYASSQHETSWAEYDTYIPKPWPKDLTDRYWSFRGWNDTRLRIDDVPEAYQTPDIVTRAFTNYPETMKGSPLVTQEIADNVVRALYNHPDRIREAIESIPETMISKKMWKEVYDQAKTLTKKSEIAEKEEYLSILSAFPHSFWPKANKTTSTMALVNKNFMGNPVEYQTPEFAVQWVGRHPYSLAKLPAQFVTEAVVNAALCHQGTTTNGYDVASVLKDCDPSIVKPEWVAATLGKLSGLENGWNLIPSDYLTHDVLEALARAGNIAFDDPHFPKDAFTPQTIVARFKRAVPMEKKVVERIASSSPHGSGYAKTTYVTNDDAVKAAFDSIPPQYQKAAAIALMKAKSIKPENVYSRHFGSSHGPKNLDYDSIIPLLPKHLLDADLLHAWLEAQSGYSRNSDIFKLFPESAHTPDNMQLAVEKRIIDKVPEHLRSDDNVMAMMRNWSGSAKTVDWKKITPDFFLKFAKIEPHDAVRNMIFNIPKTSPIFTDPRIAEVLLRDYAGEPLEGGEAKGGYRHHVGLSDMEKVYGEGQSKRRQKWTQACYDLAAGDIIPLSEVPDKFRSEAAKFRGVKTNAEDILHIPNPAAWLNKHPNAPDLPIKRLLATGIAYTDKGWVDFRHEPRTEVKGQKGSYVVTKIKGGGEAFMIFNEKGECIDALMTGAGGYHTEAGGMLSGMTRQRSDHNGDATRRDSLNNLRPYRLLIAAALEAHPEITKALPTYGGGGRGSVPDLEKIGLYRDKEGAILPVEKLPRNSLDGTDVTWNLPDRSTSYGWGKKYFLYEGNGGGAIANVWLEPRGDSEGFKSSAVINDTSKLLPLSKGFAAFLADRGVPSGQKAEFKDSPLYKLGVRGPGRGEWFSLLDEKVMEKGPLSVWKHKSLVTITDDQKGILAIAKQTKAGMKIEDTTEAGHEYTDTINKLLAAMHGKI